MNRVGIGLINPLYMCLTSFLQNGQSRLAIDIISGVLIYFITLESRNELVYTS
jgi:hypothetical protein